MKFQRSQMRVPKEGSSKRRKKIQRARIHCRRVLKKDFFPEEAVYRQTSIIKSKKMSHTNRSSPEQGWRQFQSPNVRFRRSREFLSIDFLKTRKTLLLIFGFSSSKRERPCVCYNYFAPEPSSAIEIKEELFKLI